MDSKVTRVQKLSRGGNFRAWLVHVRAWLTTSDDLDIYLDRLPVDEEERALDKQARAKLVLTLGNDMLPLVEERATTHETLEALRADHLGHMQSMRSHIMSEVTGMQQTHKQSVKDYVAVGRESLVRLREVGVDNPATLVIPCFKAGIDSRVKQRVLPLLNQSQFDEDFELLAQEFQRITVGMAGAQGTAGSAHASRGQFHHRQYKKPKIGGRERKEVRTCYVCNEVGHLARNCPKRAGEQGQGSRGEGPVVLMHEGAHTSSSNESSNEHMLFDSGATHHIVCEDDCLRNIRYSNIDTIKLGGGESHVVEREGDLLMHSPDTGRDVLLTGVLWVPTLTYNLCSGAQVTAKGVMCEQVGDQLAIKQSNNKPLMLGSRVNNLYYLRCNFVLPAEGHVHVSLATWHNRLSHPAVPVVKRMAKNQVVKGLGDVHKEPEYKCDVCVAAKLERASHPRSEKRAGKQCELIHTDVICPEEDGLQTQEVSYILTVLDDYSRYSEMAIVQRKSDVPDAFTTLVKRMERQTDSKVKAVRFDRGKEFYGVTDWLRSEGIVAQAVPARTPESNGRAERLNRSLAERARAILHHFRLPTNLWQYATEVANLTRNLVPSVGKDASPYELFFEIKPSVSHLRTFGCYAQVLVPKCYRNGKFDRLTEDGILVGYAQYSKAWKVLVETAKGFEIRETQNVHFDETTTCAALCATLREFPDADV